MATFCVPSVLPTYNSIYNQLSSLYSSVMDLTFPSMYTLPSPIWDGIRAPLIELEQTITEMISGQLILVQNYLLSLFTNFLGLSLEDILPDIPGFPGFTLIDIIAGKIKELVAFVVSDFFDLSAITLLPSPIYPAITCGIWDALNVVQVACTQYFQLLTATATNLMGQISDILGVGKLSLPSFPTLNDIYALLPSVPTLSDLLSIVIPGWGFQLAMPVPLVPNFNFPQYDIIQGFKNMYNGLSSMAYQMVINFVESVFGWGLSLPTFCISIT